MKLNATTLAIACIALAMVWLAVQFVRDPFQQRRVALAGEISAIDPNWKLDEEREADEPPVLSQRVLSREDLWERLVDPPAAPIQHFDMAGALRGITVTSRTQGEGLEMRARIITPGDPRGSYYGAGDIVDPNTGLMVKEVSLDAVVFFVQFNGREYSQAVAR